MFKFITTTIINNNLDFTTNKPRWTYSTDYFDIKRVGKFVKSNVKAVYKAAYSEPVLATATIDITDSIFDDNKVYRIAMYIRLSGSQNSYYSNDMVFKGKPLYIEFERLAGESDSDVATKIATIAKKFLTMVYEFEIVKVEAKGTKVIITATDEYQRFTKVDVEAWDPTSGPYTHAGTLGAFVVKGSATPEGTTLALVQGKEGFGTYQYMLRNFRLPTAANTRWTRIVQDETPIIGAKYNQYIIEYQVERGIMGGDAVGETTTSRTQHVFYVNQDVATDFEAGLAKIGTVQEGLKPITLQKIADITDMVKAGTKKTVTPQLASGLTGITIKKVTAATDADWLTVEPGTTNVGLTGTDNSTGEARTATVTILVTASNGATAKQDISVTQQKS